jgi:hypothetical protein
MTNLLDRFVRDESPAIEELRRFVGGRATSSLDGSEDSLAVLDAFLVNLTHDTCWTESPLFQNIPNVQSWLTVRVAYYIGLCFKRYYGGEWYLSREGTHPTTNTPVLSVCGIEVSPLEVADALLRGEVDNGLVGFFRDLELKILSTNPTRH